MPNLRIKARRGAKPLTQRGQRIGHMFHLPTRQNQQGAPISVGGGGIQDAKGGTGISINYQNTYGTTGVVLCAPNTGPKSGISLHTSTTSNNPTTTAIELDGGVVSIIGTAIELDGGAVSIIGAVEIADTLTVNGVPITGAAGGVQYPLLPSGTGSVLSFLEDGEGHPDNLTLDDTFKFSQNAGGWESRIEVNADGEIALATRSGEQFKVCQGTDERIVVGNDGAVIIGGAGAGICNCLTDGSFFIKQNTVCRLEIATDGEILLGKEAEARIVLGHEGNAHDILIESNEQARIKIEGVNGDIKFHDAYVFPGGDGGANHVLETDGAGQLNWVDRSLDGLSDAKSGGADFGDSLLIGHTGVGTLNAAEENTGVGIGVFNALTEGDNNTAIGYNALTTNTTGDSNTAVGSNALQWNTAGCNNAIGSSALKLNTTGNNNTANGYFALKGNTTGAANVAVGTNTLPNNNGNYNTAVGQAAGWGDLHPNHTTTGAGNVFLGNKAGYGQAGGSDQLYISNSATQDLIKGDFVTGELTLGGGTTHDAIILPAGTGAANQVMETDGAGQLSWIDRSLDGLSDAKSGGANFTDSLLIGHTGVGVLDTATNNTGVGIGVFNALTSGDFNTALGYAALNQNTSGNSNTAVGSNALQLNTAGCNNAIGSSALKLNTTGNNNTANGYFALKGNTTGSANVAVGTNTLTNNNGNYNTAVGWAAGWGGAGTTTGAGNVFLGNKAGYGQAGGSDQLYISNSETQDLIKGDFVTGELTLGGGTTHDAIILPAGTGAANQVMETDGAGQLSWIDRSLDGLSDAKSGGQNFTNSLLIGDSTTGVLAAAHDNTGVGIGVFNALTSGGCNNAIGVAALQNNTTGEQNTANGYYALNGNSTGSYNVGVGTSALTNNNGNYNTAVGWAAGWGGAGTTTGAGNVFLGNKAGYLQAGGSDQLYISNSATQDLIKGDFVTGELTLGGGTTHDAIILPAGTGAANQVLETDGAGQLSWIDRSLDGLSDAKSGGQNFTNSLLIGDSTTGVLAAAHDNTGVGIGVFNALTSGGCNNAIGVAALQNNTTGEQNTANGYYALNGNSTGSYNVGVGTSALTNNNGNYNTAVGWAAGWGGAGTTTGAGNVFLGNKAGYGQAGGSDQLYISNSATQDLIKGDFVTGELTLGGGTTHDAIILPAGTGAANQVMETDGAGQLSWVDQAGAAVHALDDLTDANSGGANFSNSLLIGSVVLDPAQLNSAEDNTGVGNHVLQVLTSGYKNTAIGSDCLAANTTGHSNTASGYVALGINVEGSKNTASGYSALGDNTSGNNNVAIGYYTLLANGTGDNNTACGTNALQDNTTGASNVAVGANALENDITGTYNTAVGASALSTSTATGETWNTAIGAYALTQNQTGVNNTAVGGEAGNYNLTGSSNVFLGNKAGYNETGSNKLYISNEDGQDLITGDFANDNGAGNGGGTLTFNALVVMMPYLPTNVQGLAAGQLWNESGTLKIA